MGDLLRNLEMFPKQLLFRTPQLDSKRALVIIKAFFSDV